MTYSHCTGTGLGLIQGTKLEQWRAMGLGDCQWQIQDFPEGGAPIPKLGLFCQFFAENCMKMKEFGPGGRASLAPPLRSANDCCRLGTV